MSKTLLYPYTYDKRRPLFLEGVLFIPEFFTQQMLLAHRDFVCPLWEAALSHQQIKLEYCSGNGQWILEQAKKEPEVLWIAVEMRYDRVKKIYKRRELENIKNVLIAFGKAETLTEYYLKKSCLEAVFINFPDPWPKRKHAKNRLLQPLFLENLKRSLKKGACLTLATDDQDYMEESIEALNKAALRPSFCFPHHVSLEADYGSSFFEELWAKKGKQNLKTVFYYD